MVWKSTSRNQQVSGTSVFGKSAKEPYLARNVADLVILLDDGVWAEIAPPDELFTNPKEKPTRQFLERISLKDISSSTHL